MKKNIHPKLYMAKVTCTGCGNEFETLSTKEHITVGICNQCHPFFTGTAKLVDTEGRVQRFERRFKQAKDRQQQQKNKKSKK